MSLIHVLLLLFSEPPTAAEEAEEMELLQVVLPFMLEMPELVLPPGSGVCLPPLLLAGWFLSAVKGRRD